MKFRTISRVIVFLISFIMLTTVLTAVDSFAAKKAVKINKTKVTLYVGTSTNLKVTGTNKKVKWSSTNKRVASVTSKGKIKAKKAGTASIKAKVGKKTYKCKVYVKKVPKLNKTKITLYETKSTTLKINGYKIGKAAWSSSKKSVAKVDSKGKVTAVKKGTAYIRAKIGRKTLSCKVTVKELIISKIYYELNSGVNAETNPDSYQEGKTVVLSEPTRENYEFKGWFLDKSFTQHVDKISADMKGDITLYAKWHMAPLNVNSEGLDNMIWSWWYYPQVISDDSSDNLKVFWEYADKEGYCGVAQYDQSNGTVNKTALKKADADDHNAAAITFLDDKRIMCVYSGGHNKNNEIHIRISDKPLDITTFSKHIVLESSGKTSYGQIVKSNDKYYVFYRMNNNNWAYVTSEDGENWTDEVILIKASTQYYCKAVPTTDDNIIRLVMYSNPAGNANEIRMGFIDTRDNSVYNADCKTKLENSANSYDTFQIINNRMSGKRQRLFDVAITDVNDTRFLLASFTQKKNASDSVYYMYNNGTLHKVCEGGKDLFDMKYQLGASFIDNDTIVAGRNSLDTDYVEIYKFNGTEVVYDKTLDEQIGTGWKRNARPIADVNGKAILWHNGYYDNGSYKDFDTSARMYLIEENKKIIKDDERSDSTEMSTVKSSNVQKAREFADKLYEENIMDDYTQGGFTWDKATRTTNWIYFSGFMLESFLATDFNKYSGEVYRFYKQYIKTDTNGNVSVRKYTAGELDAALPAVGMITLINSGTLSEEDKAQFSLAVNYVYNQLEKQTIYAEAGNLWLHSQTSEGKPRTAWKKWNICLDGVYMSQLFLIRLAESIDNGTIEIKAADGTIITSEQLWNDIYTRMTFVMDNMKNPDNGLLYHGYCVEEKTTNEVSWSRGIGWFAMALLEAAEKMPDDSKQTELIADYNKLMKAVIEWQDPDTYLWYNVTDGREEYVYHKTTESGTVDIFNIPESSGSAMFAYCLLRGFHDDLLKDEGYRESGLRAYNALAETKLTENGLIDIYASSSVTSNKNLYQVNGYVVNDGKGVAPFIMATKYVY